MGNVGAAAGAGSESGPLSPSSLDTRERCWRSASSSFCTRRASSPYAFAHFYTRSQLLSTKSPLLERMG